jgi:rhodanese-related sulfurtransferase
VAKVAPAATQPVAAARTSATAPAVHAISAAEFRQMQQAHPEYVVLDVRTPAEFNAGYIPGAKLIDYRAPDFDQKIAQLDRSKTYLVYCRTGNRSSHACGKLDAMNLKSYNLTGGIVAWQQASLPTTRP